MKVDLSKMNLDDLENLKREIDKALVVVRKEAKRKALDEVRRAARMHGFSLSELFATDTKHASPKSKSRPKYCNPSNSSDTWSGRGRQPEWFKKALERGASRDELAI